MYETTDRTRELRLRNTAKRQGLTLHKSHVRDPRAIGYGLFHIADENNCLVAGGALSGYSLSIDDVEVCLADADAFDVYFENLDGAYSDDDRHILEWVIGYPLGHGRADGWVLSERSNSPRDHFIPRGRTELAAAVIEARRVLLGWANADAEDAA